MSNRGSETAGLKHPHPHAHPYRHPNPPPQVRPCLRSCSDGASEPYGRNCPCVSTLSRKGARGNNYGDKGGITPPELHSPMGYRPTGARASRHDLMHWRGLACKARGAPRLIKMIRLVARWVYGEGRQCGTLRAVSAWS